MKWLVSASKALYNFVTRVIYDLLTEKQNGDERKISIGRTAFVVVLIASLHVWMMVPVVDIPPNMFLTLGSLLGYVLGTKAISSWTALGIVKNGYPVKPTDNGYPEIPNIPVVDGDEGD